MRRTSICARRAAASNRPPPWRAFPRRASSAYLKSSMARIRLARSFATWSCSRRRTCCAIRGSRSSTWFRTVMSSSIWNGSAAADRRPLSIRTQTGGHLFLGNAKAIGRHDDLFETVSKKWRRYRRLGPTGTTLSTIRLCGPAEPRIIEKQSPP
jgi:hypothetical protein